MSAKAIWIDGQLVPHSSAKIHLLNHSLHYGSAVFEGIRCYMTAKGPAVFRLKDHVDRLFHSATTMGMRIPFTKKDIVNAIKQVVRKNKLEECYIRPIIFYGDKMGLSPIGAPLHTAIAAWPWGKYLTKDAVAVKVSSFMRVHHKSSVMTAKISGHYSNSIIASLEAKKHGYDEALFLDASGNVAEGPGENIFFIKENTLYTPKPEKILPGITRDSVMKIAKRLGYKIIETNIKPKYLSRYDEAFFVGTAAEINAIGKIDKQIFSHGHEGVTTAKIREAYHGAIHGKTKAFTAWLDFV